MGARWGYSFCQYCTSETLDGHHIPRADGTLWHLHMSCVMTNVLRLVALQTFPTFLSFERRVKYASITRLPFRKFRSLILSFAKCPASDA